MKRLTFIMCMMMVTGVGSGAANAADVLPGQIHSYPFTQDTKPFKPNQLAFEPPNDGLARAEFRSQPFFAIILKSGPRCSFTESEREAIQRRFPRNQVFFEAYDCPDHLEDYWIYSNVDPDVSFLGVFGGLSKEEAQELLDSATLKQDFPGANIREMQAIISYP